MSRQSFSSQMKLEKEKMKYEAAWATSYDIEGYIDGYVVTGDIEYLEMAIKLADKLYSVRADQLGIKDWKGRLRPGWLAAERYGVTGPLIVKDQNGNPVLEIYSTMLAYNQFTTVDLDVNPDGKTFSIVMHNDKTKENAHRRSWNNLTMQTAEETINNQVGRTALKVKKIGDTMPLSVKGGIPPLAMFVMHGHHTGKILLPFLRLAMIINNTPELKARYGDSAAKYLKCAEEAYADMESDWREHPDGGYVIFEKGMPFWCDGLIEPNNTLAYTGLAYLYLYQATGKKHYLERVTKLASFMHKELEPRPDGTLDYYYWPRLCRRGWDQSFGCTYTPAYQMPLYPEDGGHLQASLRFFIECCRNNIVFTKSDLERFAKTFHARIYQGKGPKFFSDLFDGSMEDTTKHQDWMEGWAEFYDIDQSIPEIIKTVFADKKSGSMSSKMAVYGVLMRADQYRNQKK
jgi:hypothetical protein